MPKGLGGISARLSLPHLLIVSMEVQGKPGVPWGRAGLRVALAVELGDVRQLRHQDRGHNHLRDVRRRCRRRPFCGRVKTWTSHSRTGMALKAWREWIRRLTKNHGHTPQDKAAPDA